MVKVARLQVQYVILSLEKRQLGETVQFKKSGQKICCDRSLQPMCDPTMDLAQTNPFQDDGSNSGFVMTRELEMKKQEALGRVSAYSSLAVIASLLFGFAVSILFEFATEDILDKLYFQYPFCILMCVVLVCNAYSMVVMTFNYYVVYRFIAEFKIDEALLFMRHGAKYRKLARTAFRAGLFLFLICTAIFLEARIDTLNAVICAVILISGTIVIAMTIRYMMVTPEKIVKKVETMYAQAAAQQNTQEKTQDDTQQPAITKPPAQTAQITQQEAKSQKQVAVNEHKMTL